MNAIPSKSPLSRSDLILVQSPNTSTAPHRWFFTGRPDATFRCVEKEERRDRDGIIIRNGIHNYVQIVSMLTLPEPVMLPFSQRRHEGHH